MHGRVKTRSTEEEKERKRKDHAKKVIIYKASIEKVFSKRKNNELDEEGLEISGQLLSANPDIYTLWNFRKEILLHLKEERTEEELQRLIDTELYLTEVCLRYNPKSYGAWHHRCWMLNHMPLTNWKKELAVCNKYLDLDERNFHCWDYRRFVVKGAKVEPKDELEYTTEKILSNFSNYSAWHYRSKLLPLVHPDVHNVLPVEEKQHSQELDMVQSAAFTDPNDQSAWFYQRWLLGRIKPSLHICHVVANDEYVCVHFNQPISPASLKITGIGMSKWVSVDKKPFSRIIINKSEPNCLIGDQELTLEVYLLPQGNLVEKVSLQRRSEGLAEYRKPLQFHTEFSPGLTAVLQDQLGSSNQLLEYEPDSKWTLLTSVLLMQAIERQNYKDEIMTRLGMLMDADRHREGYYSDLRSKYQIEYLLEDWERAGCKPEFAATNCQLTALYHTEYMVSLIEVDFSKNSLKSRSLPQLGSLQFCQVLKLDNNKIDSLEGFPSLPYLQTLSLCNNLLSSVDSIVNHLTGCQKLTSLNLCGNHFDESEDLLNAVKEALPVKILNNRPIC